MKRQIAGVLLVSLLLGIGAVAKELEGVSLSDQATVDGKNLVLNGMGVRVKKVAFLGIKVYVAGLYLAAKESDPAKVLAADEPRQLVMHFLYKEVEKAKLLEGWNEGFQNTSPEKVAALKAQIAQFNGYWESMKSGERAVLTYIPGTGTSVEIKGKVLGTIPGKEFADALFAIWLGKTPPTEDLKKGLLGQ